MCAHVAGAEPYHFMQGPNAGEHFACVGPKIYKKKKRVTNKNTREMRQ